MRSPRCFALLTIQLTACLPWKDLWIDLDGSPNSSFDSTTGQEPSTSQDPTSLAPATSSDPSTSLQATDTDLDPSEASGSGSTSTGYDETVCPDFMPVTPGLAFNMIGQDGSDEPDGPAIALGPGCHVYMTGKLGDSEGCSGIGEPGSAYLALLNAEGTCDHVLALPGERGNDVMTIGNDVVVAGRGNQDKPLLARITTDKNGVQDVHLADTGVGSVARALAFADGDVFVAGACPEAGPDPLWLTRFDSNLLTEHAGGGCKPDFLEARALAVDGDGIYVVGATADDNAYVAQYTNNLDFVGSWKLVGADPDLGNGPGHGTGVVTSSWGTFVAIACVGLTFSAGESMQIDCDSNPIGSNIVLARLSDGVFDPPVAFGGANEQHPTALALADKDTLVMTGTFKTSITLSGSIEASVPLGETATFVAWFDINDGVITPTNLMVVDNKTDNTSFNRGFDIAVNHDVLADAQRVLVAGGAFGDMCLRSWSEPDCVKQSTAEGGQNFLAFLPVTP